MELQLQYYSLSQATGKQASMEPVCQPLQWIQPLQLPRAGSGAEFLWSQPSSFQDREVYGHSATLVGNTVWVLGGKNQAGKRLSVHCFCPKALTWSKRTPADNSHAPSKRWGHSVCEVTGKMLIVVGGFDSKHNLRDSWVLDTTQDASFADVCDDLPVFGAYHSVVFHKRKERVILFGGQCCVNGAYEYFQDVYVLHFQHEADEDLEGWVHARVRGPKPEARAQHSAVLAGAGMIIYGGANATRQFNDLWTFDLLDHMWTRLPPEGPAPPVETQIEPQAFRVRSCRSIFLCRNMQLLVLGRAPPPAFSKYSLHVYDLKSLQWRPAPMHRSADWRGNAAGWVWGDELWVHGGHHDSNEPQNILLPLLTGPSKLLRRTVQSISALPHENLKLIFSFISGSVEACLF
ncbi:unnamed protein product [Effrenium voratum]|nr:unnamed protein product [Effrenium voratum]CAJ1423491.1 unnamed protein product [Effrenium voratum]